MVIYLYTKFQTIATGRDIAILRLNIIKFKKFHTKYCVAQWLMHQAHNPGVSGSRPAKSKFFLLLLGIEYDDISAREARIKKLKETRYPYF